MKHFLLFLFLGTSTLLSAQQIDYNTKKGFVADGYDVVSYFVDHKPVEGKKKFITTYDGAKFQFSSENNLKMFTGNPKKYIPQCGGFCAYAIATRNERKEIDPETFEIRDGKLYLFYNKWFSNKLESWLEEDTAKLQKDAANNWAKLKNKKN